MIATMPTIAIIELENEPPNIDVSFPSKLS
jgi:hypothetical protein